MSFGQVCRETINQEAEVAECLNWKSWKLNQRESSRVGRRDPHWQKRPGAVALLHNQVVAAKLPLPAKHPHRLAYVRVINVSDYDLKVLFLGIITGIRISGRTRILPWACPAPTAGAGTRSSTHH